MLKKLLLILILVPVVVMTGCQGERGPIGPAGEPAVANSTCLSSECHGDSTANKIIVNDLGTEEIVPLYVNESKYASTIHGTLLCVSCHTDINASGGSHANVRKVYGGWARFGRKQAVEALDINDVVRTRNYTTAASYGCISCHKEKANFMNSAHATIFKHRSALIDADLSALCGKTVGEDYASGDCNRCHATCATCHFKSTITQINPNGSALTYWDQLQSSYPNVPGWDDKMTEFSMDWTTNVVSHEFRGADYFAADSESVCEACHTGYAKPASMAYWWLDEANGVWDSIKATAVKRHPQAYELAISGDPSYQSGGNNTAHAGKKCAGCHGGNYGNVHDLPGINYEWEKEGDVKCVDCHPSPNHTTPAVAQHYDDSGIKVACVGCHTFGLARDFDSSSGGHDVFIDPVTGEIRPVVNKHSEAKAWYSHNWQTLDPGTGTGDPQSDCAKKCHYSDNKVGASAWL